MAVLAARQFYGAFTMDNRVPTRSIIHAFTMEYGTFPSRGVKEFFALN